MALLSLILLEGSLLSPNPGLIFWTAVTFLILLFVLRATAWTPIVNALDERERSIQSAIARAEQARTEAEKLLAEHKAMLAKAQLEADRIIQESRVAAEKIRSEILEKANAEARKMIEEAKLTIATERQRALAALRDEVAELAIKSAELIIRHNLDAERHKELIAAALNEMPAQVTEFAGK
ncbi:MAG: F0F1 ATP synthase subunit B [Chloroherpetonaceae bacterium]|nr:F0F1 ATP synthase subunit B [Chloroherpetonaceae bacterium]MCS7211894.1 F0F1 ATP synthase subunit B [Chloroherpetonaceae bacterium]MDW8019667.1 F0F1 ATP synthase subunit B [Chloroherpetonaceae bacterium]MDW8465260.1 F0F1 ATP synthase subunit B [Chloroherpetonaceae bacterium]